MTINTFMDNYHLLINLYYLNKLVKKLPDKYRDVILMFYMEEMNEAEISKALSIPKGTVKSRLNKARALLKEMIING